MHNFLTLSLRPFTVQFILLFLEQLMFIHLDLANRRFKYRQLHRIQIRLKHLPHDVYKIQYALNSRVP